MGSANTAISRTKAILITIPARGAFYTAGDRVDVRWVCHGDIQRVNIELHRDGEKDSLKQRQRRRSLVIASHRPMALGAGLAHSSMMWRIPKDYDRTGEQEHKWRNRTLEQQESRIFWDDGDEEQVSEPVAL